MRTHKIALDEPSNNEGIIESHISSFIVFCQAEKQAAVAHSLRAQADIELHGSDEKGVELFHLTKKSFRKRENFFLRKIYNKVFR